MTNSNYQTLLKHMKDSDLLSAAHERVRAEKAATLAVLHCLREIEQRRLHIARGFQSLFDFATRELGYSPAAAQRRILAMRLLREIPALEAKIEQGLMTLDTAARAQGFFKQEEKLAGQVSLEKKKEVLAQLEGKSSRQCERILASRSSQPESFLRPDSIKPVGKSSVEVRFVAEEGLMKDLARLRELLSHKNPSISMAELIGEMAKIVLAKLDPARQSKAGAKTNDFKTSRVPAVSVASQSVQTPQEISVKAQVNSKANLSEASPGLTKASVTPAPELKSELKSKPKSTPRTRTRYIPLQIRRDVFKRDGYRCTYFDPLSGRRCESRFQLELDHWRVPFAQGGENNAGNLKVVCKSHNQWRAVEIYGYSKMSGFLGGKP
jgi:hypothetical protein